MSPPTRRSQSIHGSLALCSSGYLFRSTERLDRPELREQRRARDREHPVVEHLLRVQLRPVAGAVADGRVEVGLHEVDQLAARVEAQVDLRMLLIEVAEPRQQPLLQERAEQADVEQAAAAILAQLIDRARELAHAALDRRAAAAHLAA